MLKEVPLMDTFGPIISQTTLCTKNNNNNNNNSKKKRKNKQKQQHNKNKRTNKETKKKCTPGVKLERSCSKCEAKYIVYQQ